MASNDREPKLEIKKTPDRAARIMSPNFSLQFFSSEDHRALRGIAEGLPDITVSCSVDNP